MLRISLIHIGFVIVLSHLNSYIYSTYIFIFQYAQLRYIGAIPLGIKMEEDGPDMAHFREILSAWDPNDKEKW